MGKDCLIKAGSVLIAFVLTLGSLVACGKNSDNNNSPVSAGKTDAGVPEGGSGSDAGGSAKTDPSKEYVYHINDVALPDITNSGYKLAGSGLVENRVCLVFETDSRDEDGRRYDYWLVTMEKDGSLVESTILGVPDSKAPGRNEGTDSSGEDEASNKTLEVFNFERFVFSSDRIYAIERWRYDDYSPENTLFLSADYVCSWNMDGSLLWETHLEGLEEEKEYLYVKAVTGNPKGSLYLYLSGDSFYCQEVSADGTLGERKPLSDEVGMAIEHNQYLLPKNDGSVIMLYSDEYDWTKQYLMTYNPETKHSGQSVKAPISFAANESAVAASLKSDLIYGDDRGIYCYNIGDETITKKMDFINSDINIASIDVLIEIDENSFFCIYTDYFWKTSAGIFTYVDPKDIPDKKILVMAGVYISTSDKKRVVEFNQSSQEYRIVLKDYYDMYGASSSLDDCYTQLNLDIVSGNMPDILICEVDMPVERYAAKGLLADIGELLQSDPELSQAEFTENVFDAYSIGGRLYQVIPGFSIETIMGKTALLGDRSSWTMADMQRLQESLPSGTSMFTHNIDRNDYINWLMKFCGADYVDVDTGKCDFDTPEFMAAMEFGKNLPEELNQEFWNTYSWKQDMSGFRNGSVVLYLTGIYEFKDLKYALNGYIGEDTVFIGFPSDSGQGSVIGLNESYCIFAKTENKEGAWEYLRYYLTDEYQKEQTYILPTRKDVLRTRAEEVTRRPYYWMDSETGEKDEYDDTVSINGEDIIVPPLTGEQAQQCLDFICSVNKRAYGNWDVIRIIEEELGSFYSGQKSAKQVAEIIQNRVQLFVDENS